LAVSNVQEVVDAADIFCHLMSAAPTYDYEAHQVTFVQRFYDYDMRDYPRGFYFNFFGLIRILKFKTNTVAETDRWITIVAIFRREFVLNAGVK
jgi:hypothetical protein